MIYIYIYILATGLPWIEVSWETSEGCYQNASCNAQKATVPIHR